MKVRAILLGFLVSCQAWTINTVDITAATLAAAVNHNSGCLNYKIPTHFCMWARGWPTHVSATPILDHYLPDLVVTVYRNNDENPWVEVRTILDKASSAVQNQLIGKAGSGDHPFLDHRELNIIFKEADIIGNPALAADILLQFGLLLLPSTAMPMFPYYQSMIDSLLWRGQYPYALPEEALSLAYGFKHHVGTGFTDWGGIYPHEGTVMALDDAKAAMVVASRAADLLTNTEVVRYGHVFKSLPIRCGKKCKVAPIIENSKETLYQMIYPLNRKECVILGSDKSDRENMQSKDGAYVWVVWRHYRGCADGKGKYIGHT